MISPAGPTRSGHVASLHLHPAEPGAPLCSVESFDAVAAKGIQGDHRYFERVSRRQISLMEREQIARHAAALRLSGIEPGAARANIETVGVDLVASVGKQVLIGEALLFLYEPRMPCAKMDAVCAGLRGLMQNSRQGVMAEVIRSGVIRVGDSVLVRD
jgi:MOSC domain-containing protein YiiM